MICQKCQSYYKSVQQAYKDVVNNRQDRDNVNKEDTICADVAAAVSHLKLNICIGRLVLKKTVFVHGEYAHEYGFDQQSR